MVPKIDFDSDMLSNSFLILGREIDILKVTSKMIKEKQIYALGEDLTDGQEVFRIKTSEELAFLKSLNKLDLDRTFTYLDTCLFADVYEGEIDVKNLPRSGKVQYYSGIRDESSSKNIETLKERYDEYGNVSIGMQKYLRSKKINKIEKNQ